MDDIAAAGTDQVLFEIEPRQIVDAQRRHQQDLDSHGGLGLQRAGMEPRISGGEVDQGVRQAQQRSHVLWIVKLSQARSILLGEAAAADIEAAHDPGHLVEVMLFDVQVMPGDRLQRADEIIDRGRRLAAAALDQEHQAGFEGFDLDKIA